MVRLQPPPVRPGRSVDAPGATQLPPGAFRIARGVYHEPAPVIRPWGWYTVVGVPNGLPIAGVKTLVVEPGQALSLQTHRWRAERWMPLSPGLGAVIGEEEHELLPGHVYDIEVGVQHRLLDHAGAGGSVIELMYGWYDEDDIVRVADRYQRT